MLCSPLMRACIIFISDFHEKSCMVFTALLAGIVAAFTPCIIVLFPLLLYRFRHGAKPLDYVQLASGFLLFFLFASLLLSHLFASPIQNGLRLGLGLLFVVLGILSFLHRLNPFQLPVLNNLYILGAVFALALSLNPCTLPYLGFVLTQDYVFIRVLLFGVGLLVPGLLFSLFGQKLIASSQRIMRRVEPLMHGVLILSGVYLVLTLQGFFFYDLLVVELFLIAIFLIILRAFFVVRTLTDLKHARVLFLLLALFGIVFAAYVQCDHALGQGVAQYTGERSELTCHAQSGACEVCTRCLTIFGIAAVLGMVGIMLSARLQSG